MQRQELLNKFYQEAESNGCKELAEELIALGANYHNREGDSTIALMNAAKSGDLETVKKLSVGDVNLVDEDDKTALMHASENGQLDVVKYLLSQKADVFMKAEDNDHALKLAAENGHLEVVNELIVKISNKKGTWPLTEALEEAISEGHTDIANALIAKLESVSCKALENAVKNNDITMVKKLIPKVHSLNFSAGFAGTCTVLGIAAEEGYKEIVLTLLKAGANVDKFYGVGGAAPLFLAAEKGHVDIVNILLENGADPNLYEGGTSLKNYSPLMIAAKGNHVEIIKALVAKGAEINAYSHCSFSRTALMIAAEYGNEDAVRELINLGADLNLEQAGLEDTALDLARDKNHTAIVEILRNAGGRGHYH